MFLADTNWGGIMTLIAILATAGVIAIVAFIIHRVMHPKLKTDDEKPSEAQIMQEELDRVLQPVEDEETAKEISEYKDEE